MFSETCPSLLQTVYWLQADAAAQDHRHALERSMLQRAVEEEVLRKREKMERAHTKLAKAQTERVNQQALQEADVLRTLRMMSERNRYCDESGVWLVGNTMSCNRSCCVL